MADKFISFNRIEKNGEHCLAIVFLDDNVRIVVRYDEVVDALDQLSNFNRCESIAIGEVKE